MKNQKGCMKTFLAMIIFVGVAFVLIMVNQIFKERRAKIDEIEKSKICDTIKYITEQPEILFDGFAPKEIEKIHFFIIRNNKIFADSVVSNAEYSSVDKTYKKFKIPFDSFLKTDSIIVKTSNQYFKVPQFHHYAYLEYGNFGYLGRSHCRVEEEKRLKKSDGFTKNILPTETSH